MRTIIVSHFVSLDGVMEAPGAESGHAHSGWVVPFAGSEHMQYKRDEILAAESLLVGRVTYESFAEAWPARANAAGHLGEMAVKLNAMPKHVVSSTLRNPAWNNCQVIAGDIIGGIKRIKEKDGGPILVAGSIALTHLLLENDLVDELRIMLFPVAIGSGRRLFPESPRKTTFWLADVGKFSTGVVVNTYLRSQ